MKLLHNDRAAAQNLSPAGKKIFAPQAVECQYLISIGEIFLKKSGKKRLPFQKKCLTLHRKRQNVLPNAKIAQLVEHDLAKVGVAGSSPVFRSSFFYFLLTRLLKLLKQSAKIAQLVEHDLAKVGVAGSSPVFRSMLQKLFPNVRVVELVDTLL